MHGVGAAYRRGLSREAARGRLARPGRHARSQTLLAAAPRLWAARRPRFSDVATAAAAAFRWAQHRHATETTSK
ncbi:unnamed protein product [Pieris macdunnoughi]|uniref:Uncharacterized protein n=1 Tax=Pieris macdunnoughi TaxID=345717 RepID=A0A821XY65_9NEOP|nr:unnamed protein product [Pieris macdunnoughi]